MEKNNTANLPNKTLENKLKHALKKQLKLSKHRLFIYIPELTAST